VNDAEELPVAECWALLRSTPVGRLARVTGEPPDLSSDIHPVNHVVDHGSIVFRTADGTKLRSAVHHPVAFEVDGYDAESSVAWSVVVKGRAHEIVDPEEAIATMLLPLTPWHAGRKPRLVRIEPTTVTGRRFPVGSGEAARWR
jgi:uncharacterized protein